MAIFDGWSLFSDIDGTLLAWDEAICKKNIEALSYFTQNGGRFSVATGRGLQGIERLACKPFLNMPCVLSNGGVLWDPVSGEFLYQQALPEKAREMAKIILEKYPDRSLFLWDLQTRFDFGAMKNSIPEYAVIAEMDSITQEWMKLVVHVDPQEGESFMEWLRELGEGEVEISTSNPNFIEVLPKSVSKGKTVAMAIALLELDSNQVAVIGDYMNDYEMLTLPGVHSFCPSNASDEIKAVAGEMLCSAEDGAVAELIYKLPSLLPVR